MLSKEEQNIAENIRQLMDDRGISLRQLEELTGINHSTIHSFLHRGRSPRVGAVVDIAKALEVPFETLLAAPKKRKKQAVA